MSKEIVLHIGMPKTGTSALQVFLARNRDLLEANGIYYPSDQSVQLAMRGRITSGNGLGLAKYLNPQNPHSLSGSEWLDRFFNSQPPPASTVLFSSEFLCTALPGPLADFSERAAVAGFSIRVVAYVRPQDECFVSWYSQAVKHRGEVRSLGAFAIAMPSLMTNSLRYLPTLDRFASILGTDSMQVRVFDPEQFVNGNLVYDFLAQLGLSASDSAWLVDDSDERINPALSQPEAELMRRLNRIRLPSAFVELIQPTYRWSYGQPRHRDRLVLDAYTQRLVREKYADCNRTLESRYLSSQRLRFNASSGDPQPLPRMMYARLAMLVLLAAPLFLVRAIAYAYRRI